MQHNNIQLFYNFRIEYKDKIILTKELNSDVLEIVKPRGRTKIENYKDFSTKEKDSLYEWFFSLKKKALKDGYLCYDDAYFLSYLSLSKRPNLIKIIQKRFFYAFIDEMQDMDTHQYELIEKIFYEDGHSQSILQRIGDKNQAIYNSVKADLIWQDRTPTLKLINSQRLSPAIVNIVKNFAVSPKDCSDMQGLYECELMPHILLFTNESIEKVIPYFLQLVQTYRNSGQLNFNDKTTGKIKVISWSTDWKDETKKRDNSGQVRLIDYYKSFKKNEQKPKEDYNCLKSYLHFYDKNTLTLSAIRKNIFHALLKILRIENISTNENRLYTITNLIHYLKEKSQQNHEELSLKIYQCCLKIIRNEKDQALSDLKLYIPTFISYFEENHRLSSKCQEFINTDTTGISPTTGTHASVSNIVEENNLKLEITSVHSVKGQTHDATLYLESCFHEHESKHLTKQFLGKNIDKKDGVRVKQATKMAYVGFSRATQLLCVAIHKDRFDKYLSEIDRELWDIKEIL